jgi:hypothetical protein
MNANSRTTAQAEERRSTGSPPRSRYLLRLLPNCRAETVLSCNPKLRVTRAPQEPTGAGLSLRVAADYRIRDDSVHILRCANALCRKIRQQETRRASADEYNIIAL